MTPELFAEYRDTNADLSRGRPVCVPPMDYRVKWWLVRYSTEPDGQAEWLGSYPTFDEAIEAKANTGVGDYGIVKTGAAF